MICGLIYRSFEGTWKQIKLFGWWRYIELAKDNGED